MNYIASFKEKMAFDLGSSEGAKLNVAIAPPGMGAVTGLKELLSDIASDKRQTLIDLNKTPEAFVYAENAVGLLELSAGAFSSALLGGDAVLTPHFVGAGALSNKLKDLSYAESGLLIVDMRDKISEKEKAVIEDFCLTKSALQKDFSRVSVVLLAQHINDLPEKLQHLSKDELYTFVCSMEKEDPFITSGHISEYLKDKRSQASVQSQKPSTHNI